MKAKKVRRVIDADPAHEYGKLGFEVGGLVFWVGSYGYGGPKDGGAEHERFIDELVRRVNAGERSTARADVCTLRPHLMDEAMEAASDAAAVEFANDIARGIDAKIIDELTGSDKL